MRAFSLAVVGAGIGALEASAARVRRFSHPEPRPGVDGSKVLASDQVREDMVELFDGVREIPHIVDGLGCHCGCGAMPEMRSLLSCYEGIGMAQFCVICSGEGRLAVQLHAEGRSLQEIREAIDSRFG
ncbi:MAG: hypothetical protein AAF389_03700 [Gemmatimonadota bacterium]